MPFLVFIFSLIISAVISYGEPLRKIQGPAFLVMWPLLTLVAYATVWMILHAIIQKRTEPILDLIDRENITHIDIPHLKKHVNIQNDFTEGQTLTSPLKTNILFSGYYLLRLYLLGIVQYSSKVVPQPSQNAEAAEERVSCLSIHEEKLESIRNEGGRHSAAAMNMIHYIRSHEGCSIQQLLTAQHILPEDEETPLGQEISKEKNHTKCLACFVLAAVLGLAGGLIVAKLMLAHEYGKPAGYLAIMGFCCPFVFLWAWCLAAENLLNTFCNPVNDAILQKLSRCPHEIGEALISKVNCALPLQLERHNILNAYFYSLHKLLHLAETTEEHSLMRQFALEYRTCIDREEARIIEERKKKSSDSSGCSSCSSCGGCGGCGGCGD